MASLSTDQAESVPVDDWAALNLAAKGALALAGTFVAVGLFTLGAALPPLQADFADAPNAALLIQLIGSIAAPAFALASPVAGRMVGRYGVKTVYLASLMLFVVAGVAPALCNSLTAILALRVVVGLAVAGAFTAGMAGIARLPESQRHIMYGLTAFVGGGIAIFAYPMVGSLAAKSWQAAFFVHLILLPAAILALFLPRRRWINVRPGVSAMTSRRFAGVPPQLLLAAAVIGWTMVSSSIYSPFYLAAMGVTNPEKVGFILSVMAMSSLVGSGSYGFAQKLLGTRGMVLLGMALAGSGCALLAMGGALPLVMVGLGLMGAGLAMFGAAGYALAIEAVGADGDPGAATGVVSFALYLPQVLFPIVAGALGGAFGPPAVYAMLAVSLAVASVLAARPIRPLPGAVCSS